MKVYDYKQINNCVICGSIENGMDTFIENVIEKLPNTKSISQKVHPKELERQERLKRKKEEEERELLERIRNGGRADGHDGMLRWRNPFDDGPRPFSSSYEEMKKKMRSWNGNFDQTVIVVCGTCGIGGKDINYYFSKFEELNKALADNNSYVLFVRGCKDDPQIFNEEIINLSNIKTIPDYSVLMFESFNCLCIGGSISLDREWKKAQEERIGRKMYWEDENFVYKEKEIKEILDTYDIACVISNTCPSFAFPGTNSFNKSSWALKDKSILKDILNERKLMDKVYEKIMDKNKKPFVWAYSRYGINNQSITNDILFQSLSKQMFLSFNSVVESSFGVSFKKKLSYNNEIMDELVKKLGNVYTKMEAAEEDGDNWIEEDIGGMEREEEVAEDEELPDDFFEDAAPAPQLNGRDFVADILMTDDEEANGTVNTVIGTLRAN